MFGGQDFIHLVARPHGFDQKRWPLWSLGSFHTSGSKNVLVQHARERAAGSGFSISSSVPQGNFLKQLFTL